MAFGRRGGPKGTRIPGLKSGKGKQYAILAGVLLAIYGGMYLIFATSSNEPTPTVTSNADIATTHIRAAGEQVDPRDAWVGGAGKEVAEMRQRVTKQDQSLEALNRRFAELQKQISDQRTPPPAPAVSAPKPEPVAATTPEPAVESAATPSPSSFPPATPGRAAGALSEGGPLPNWLGARGTPAQAAPQATPPTRALGQFRVRLPEAAAAAAADAKPATATASFRRDDRRSGETFLPVGLVKARLIGGIDAPTGGQAQNNPLPVTLRIADLAILPNHFRANLKGCLAVGAAYGELSAERAYARIELLSCIRHDGQVLETPVHGVIYDETGKLGMRGYVRTKQGQVLANAALAAVVGGFGRGFAMSATETSTSALGTVSSASGSDAFKAGLGQGFGRAFDRMADYYIRLAEQLFPVIEVHGGRDVDIVFTKGVQLPVPLPDSNQLALGYFDED